VIPASVDYLRAESFEQAFEALADPEAKALAGGQSLLPVLKLRVVRPSLLVDIGGLQPAGATTEDGHVSISALTNWDELVRLPELDRGALDFPGLAAIGECARGIGDLQVRNRGTLGGSLAHADPASDMPAVALALGAQLVLRSAGGERTLDADDFFVGPFLTSLAPGELLVDVRIPLPPPGSASAYAKVEHPASGFALAGAAALVRPDGSRAVAVAGLGAHAFLLADGSDPEDALAAAEVFGDEFADADYRRHLAGVVVRRALASAERRVLEAA
jgi:aerobic carbon-monoxide dehydrogenase medium subunit